MLYLYRMQKYNILELTEKELPELQQIASDLGIKKMKSLEKQDLIYKILDEQAVSLAGIQMEKEKEKEARKSEQKAKQATARKNRVTEKAVPSTDSDNSPPRCRAACPFDFDVRAKMSTGKRPFYTCVLSEWQKKRET